MSENCSTCAHSEKGSLNKRLFTEPCAYCQWNGKVSGRGWTTYYEHWCPKGEGILGIWNEKVENKWR